MADGNAGPRRVLVLVPMPIELRPVVRRLGLRPAGRGLRTGTVGGKELTAALVGVGPDRAASTASRLLKDHGPHHVVIAGIAGGVGPDVEVGKVVVPQVVVEFDRLDPSGSDLGVRHYASALGRAVLQGQLVTSGRILDRPTLTSLATAGVDAVDMETATVAAVCVRAGVTWTVFRGISDHIAEELVDQSTISLVGADGRPDLRAVARYMARRPGNALRLARLARGTRAATSAVAAAVESALLTEQPTSH